LADIGKLLRGFRKEWGLSLRQVKERSEVLAELWGHSSHVVSFSYLAKIESGKHDVQDMAVSKLLSLSEIYSKEPDALLSACRPPRLHAQIKDPLGGPINTQLITEGRLADRASQVLPDQLPSGPPPTKTSLVGGGDTSGRNRYRRAIVGTSDLTMFPMIRPGTILTADTYQRTIAPRKTYSNEFDRPIYLLDTREGYVCAWCDLEQEGMMVRIVPHPLGQTHFGLLKYGKDVEVVGRVIFVAMSLDS
jgi:transcriptional regulator with XRE-family HTH domain